MIEERVTTSSVERDANPVDVPAASERDVLRASVRDVLRAVAELVTAWLRAACASLYA